MMVPFDQTGVPQQGQPRPMQPMPGPHVQASPVMQPGHHQPMNPPPYSHRPSSGMPGQPPHHYPPMPPPSPAQRQNSFSGGMPTSGPQYSSHAPLHQQQPPSYPMNHPAGMHHPQMGRSMGGHSGSMGHSSSMGHAASMGMPPMPNQHMPPQHDPMLNQSSSHRPPPPQPPPPPPPQQYMNNPPPPQPSAPGNWQSERDTPHRREMIQQIVKLLKKDRNSSPESMSKLPQMAKHLEVSLYRNARSFEAYVDKNTLKHRLHQIAAEVSRKSRNQGEAPRDDRYRSARSDQSVNSFQSQNGPAYAPNMNGSSYPGQNGMRGGSTSPYMSSSSNRGTAASGMINMQDELSNSMSNRSAGGYPSGMSQPLPPQPAPLPPQQQPAVPPPPQQQRSLSPSVGQNRNDPDWKMKIRHKQQRLLLLHHSAKCTSKGPCPVTPHCADMKRLWGHMEGCKDNHCRMPHCFSSRAILSHYRKCKDPACPACGPVRETVRKSRGTSRSGRMPPSNPLMGSTRPTAQIPPTQSQPLVAPSDSMSHMSMNSFGNQSMPQSRSSPVSHSGMPPPNKAEMPFSASSQFRSSNAQAPSSSAPQQMYRSDQPTVENRSISSMHAQPHVAPSVPSSSMPTQYPKDSSVTMPASARPAGSSESEWQKIRHKQQRLLLLRHASRCQHEAGTCPVTPHCANMKKLWDHIAHCKNQQCDVQHCLSSRYILSHYRRCKNPICPSCGPVRESIRKSAEREKKMQMMKQPNSSHHQSSNPSFDSGGDFREALGNFQGNGAMGDFNDHDNLQEVHEIGNGFPETEMDKSDDIPLHHGSDEIPESNVPSMSVPSPSLHSSSSPPEHFEPQQKRPRMEVSSSNVNELSTAPESVESAPVTVEKRATPELSSSSAVATNRSESSETNKNSDHSLLNSFTIEQLNTHLGSLDRKLQLPPAKLKAKCLEVLKGLQTHQHGWVFNCPVDPVELGLPDYFDIIKKPMDLGTIQKRLESSNYHCIKDFGAHVHLTFDNAMTYNEEGSVVFGMAKELKTKFEIDMEKLMAQLEEEDMQRRQNERACMLCGCEKLLFEPPVYFCNGMNCPSQRIRRNNNFYIGGNNQYFWCSSCYNELDDKIPIELVDMTIMKKDLRKKRNDEVHEESWVQCDSCERWVHQICGLFNTRQNKEHHSEYCCPRCLHAKRKNSEAPSPRPPGAAELPRTLLSEWIERHVQKRVERKKREIAEEKAQAEGITVEDAMRQMEYGGTITIRQVTSMDRKLEVRELMKKRYEHKNYPDEFPFRCKCLVVFQNLDGVDVILFALYLYEHGEDNPPPNQKVVYISYLDSVHFMRPRILRTFVYHEILISYFDYVRRKGFATAHIWACPPLKGDDYIFFAKPEDQKTPRDNRLRQWYIDMLVECQKRNIVGKLTNMYDQYFANKDLDATAVPYLEGDYFPGEAENIIKMLEEGRGKKNGNGGKKKKSKATKSKGTTGTRSSGVDEEALIESGILSDMKSYKDLDRDQVMVKLGETIQPMKDSFIVAFLNWAGAKEEDLVVPESIEKARAEYAEKGDYDLTGSKRDAMGNLRENLALDNNGRPVKVINDDEEDLDCEFLNNRQAFLNLCRGNHYQFDELRRAKHTSMMVLWHLHNRDAPKFVQQCVACNREILSGVRYHCNTCPDFDLCEECYKDPQTNRGTCTHELSPIAVEPDSSQERNGLTEAERKQRQRNLMMHIQLIEHASACVSNACQSSNCAKMKNYLHHAGVCRVKVQGGCKICKRIWTLLRVHAQKCKKPKCPIPHCIAIREKMRQLQKQQQAMDDRRRLEMNRHMRFSVTGDGGH